MRITYLHQYFVTPAGSGGTRSYELAKRMVVAGHSVTVVTSSALLTESELQAARLNGGVLEVGGIRCEVLDVSYSNSMSFSRRILAFLHFAVKSSIVSVRTRSDVVYATSTPLTVAVPALLTKFFRRVPMVFEVRDLWPELPIAMGALRNPAARKLALGLEWIAYHSASHIVALSPGMAEGVMGRGITEERVSVVPNSCDVARFNVPTDRLFIEEVLGFDLDSPVVLYAGTFGAINGVEYLVDLASAVRAIDPGVQFLLIGQGAMEGKIVNRARELDLLDKTVHVRSMVAKERMPHLLGSATLATSVFRDIPAMRNNSANKFFDALAAGKPIVINYGGWHHDLLEKSGAGLGLQGLPLEEAASRLVALIRDPESLRRAEEASYELAAEFDRDLLAAKVIDVVESVETVGL